MSEQPSLLDWQAEPEKVRRFRAWLDGNPEIWRLFCRFTRELIARGFEHYSADAVLHRVRWETATASPDNAGWKVNNDFVALLARRFAQAHPEHATFFRFRKSMFDHAIPAPPTDHQRAERRHAH